MSHTYSFGYITIPITLRLVLIFGARFKSDSHLWTSTKTLPLSSITSSFINIKYSKLTFFKKTVLYKLSCLHQGFTKNVHILVLCYNQDASRTPIFWCHLQVTRIHQERSYFGVSNLWRTHQKPSLFWCLCSKTASLHIYQDCISLLGITKLWYPSLSPVFTTSRN